VEQQPADYLARYYTYTEKASDLCRQLAFAAIAILWALNNGTGSSLPRAWLLVGLCVVATLMLDFFQYLFGAAAWRYQARTTGRWRGESISTILGSLFCLKVCSLLTGYVLLIRVLWLQFT
jgi:hypothetical protein